MELHSLRELEEATNVASHWRYKSEGELNLVLTYTGPNPTLRAKVLRCAASRGPARHRVDLHAA